MNHDDTPSGPGQADPRDTVRRPRTDRGPCAAARTRRPRHHLLQHRQPAGTAAAPAHLPAPDARALPVSRPDRPGEGSLPRGRARTGSAGAPGHEARARRVLREQGRADDPGGRGRLHPRARRHRYRSRGDLPDRWCLEGRADGSAAGDRRSAGRGHDPHPAVSPLQRDDHPLRGQAGRLLPGRGARLEAERVDARGEHQRGAPGGNEGQGHSCHQPRQPDRFGARRRERQDDHRLRPPTTSRYWQTRCTRRTSISRAIASRRLRRS